MARVEGFLITEMVDVSGLHEKKVEYHEPSPAPALAAFLAENMGDGVDGDHWFTAYRQLRAMEPKIRAFDWLFSKVQFGAVYIQHPQGTDVWTITADGKSGTGKSPEAAILDLKAFMEGTE